MKTLEKITNYLNEVVDRRYVENIIISDSKLEPDDAERIFQDEKDNVYYTTTTDIPTLMVELGVYNSKSEAKKAGRVGKVADGYSEIKASKTRKFYIWNPR